MRPISFALVALSLVFGESLARGQDPETVFVPMRDGVKLATDVYRPGDGEKHGAVLVRTPYGRKKVGARAREAVLAGFAVVIQDDRGRYDSEGEKLPFAGSGFGERGDDGADTIAWIRTQPWASGKVATYGASALGIVQNFTAAAHPEGLVAQWIEVAAADLYGEATYPGGVLREEQIRGWTVQNQYDPKALELMISHPLRDDYWRLFDARSEFARVSVPATHMGGWFDSFVAGTIATFEGRQEQGGEGARGHQRLIVGPWTHTGRGRRRQGEIDFPDVAAQPPGGVADPLRFFGHYLEGFDTGVERDPVVTYWVLGKNEWRTSATWPPQGLRETRWFLHGSGELSPGAPGSGEPTRTFRHDPKNPVPTLGGRNLTIDAGPRDQRPIESRPDVLVWTSRPLEKALNLAGEITATITIASVASDVDVHVRLTDVSPDGRSILLLDGARKASLRDGFSKPEPLEPGKAVSVPVDLGPIAVWVEEGHSLRVVIAGSNAPRFAVSPVPSENTVVSGELTLPEVPFAPKKVWR
jgi:predicted acyl esterase